MEDYIKRDLYLKRLIDRRENGEIKIITGCRRCGKSWLLKKIYRDYLIGSGVPEKNIISISFDLDDMDDGDYIEPATLKRYLNACITDETERYYVFLDEVQMVEGFERIVNGLNARGNVDVYITGSNSKFLSTDINTIFRGRGDEIRVYPLSFKEFSSNRTEDISTLWKEYYTYGGLPALYKYRTTEQKIAYLQRLWQKTYMSDIVERNSVRNPYALEMVADFMCSSIGSLNNPNKISNAIQSVGRTRIDSQTIYNYIKYLEDAFLFEGAKRYNIKDRRYYESIKKYYVLDLGLRNVKLNFRQMELTHIMENIIYNELRIRGYLVDVGIVEGRRRDGDGSDYVQYEVDFVATDGMDKYYIQSAYSMPTEEKEAQEMTSLLNIDDSFRKVIIVGDDIATYTDNHGIVHMGLFQFLINSAILA